MALFYKTQVILWKLCNIHITIVLILSGCISLLQPLNTAVNKLFKGWLHKATKEYLNSLLESKGDVMKWTVLD